jgi:cytochrome oxidase Cu insertion factor (SCO1/SenC/PrrC family)
MAACGANSDTPEAPTATAVTEPTSSGPRTGELAPDFTLNDHNGSPVHLADELQENQEVVLVFYSGYE